MEEGSGKPSRKDGGVEIASQFVQQNNQWMASIRLPTLWNMDPIRLQLPRPEIAAREVDPDHVQRLYDSFLKLDSCRDIFDIVIRDNKLAEIFRASKSNFDVKLLLPKSLRREVISGSHSFLAVTRLQRDFPDNKLWKSVACRVHICPDNPQFYEELRNFGVLENIRSEARKNMDYASILKAMRTKYIQMRGDGNSDRDGTKTALANQWAAMTTKSMSTMWHYVIIATQKDEVWEKVKECLHLVDPKKKKCLFTSNWQFSNLSTLTYVEDRVHMLNEFIKRANEGKHWTIKQWHAATQTLGARRKIEDYIKQTLKDISPRCEGRELSMVEVFDMYPSITAELIHSLTPRVIGYKMQVPEDVRIMLKSCVEKDDSAAAEVGCPFALTCVRLLRYQSAVLSLSGRVPLVVATSL
jgi:hypothetical protein